MFKDHHYLRDDLHRASRCYVGVWDDKLVAFGASITMPNGYIKNAWRGHRTVVLPDYQGLGIGVNFSNAMGQIHIDQGLRYFSRTAHPRMIYHRNNSPLWRPTTKNMKLRKDITHKNIYNNHYGDNKRICGSHEYIGDNLF